MNAGLEHSPPASRELVADPGIPVIHGTVCAGAAETHYLRAGDGSPVVLLHGAGDAVESWSSLVRILSTRFRVILPREVRYQAPDAAPPARDGTGGSTWLRDFLEGLGLHRVSLVASGEAEALAVGFARAEPERVERLVLLGAITAGPTASGAPGEQVVRLLDPLATQPAGAPGPADPS